MFDDYTEVDLRVFYNGLDNWRFELGAPNSLIRMGWKKDTLPVGVAVEVEGFRAKAGGAVANGRSIKTADGKELFSGGSAPAR